MSASAISSRSTGKASSYKTYTNAIAEYTATVERLRSRRNSIQDSSFRSSTLSRDSPISYRPQTSVYSSSYSGSQPSLSSGSSSGSYVSRMRDSFKEPSVSSTSSYRRQSWRSSIADLSDLPDRNNESSDESHVSTRSRYSRLDDSADRDKSSTFEPQSAYATLPRRRNYTRAESLDRAREILASNSGRSHNSESKMDPDLSLTSSSRSRPLESVQSSYSSRYSSRKTSPVRTNISRRSTDTPELQLYGMHWETKSSVDSLVGKPSVSTGTGENNETCCDLADPTHESSGKSCTSNLLSGMNAYPYGGISQCRIDKSFNADVSNRASVNYGGHDRNGDVVDCTRASFTLPSSSSRRTYHKDDKSMHRKSSPYSTDTEPDVENKTNERNNQQVDEQEVDWPSKYSRRPSHRRIQPLRGSVNVDDSSDRAGLIGLKNIGNTCFMNSILQCLSNTRALRDYCTSGQYQSDLNASSSHRDGPLISAFADVMEALWKKHSSYSSNNAYDPDRFHRKIQQYAPRFSGYLQQDAQEFLRYLLEGIHEDVNRVTVKVKPETSDIPDHLTDTQKSTEAWKRYLKRDNSKIVDLYVGQLKSSLVCDKCSHCSVTFDPFWDLALPIPASKSYALADRDTNIYDCFKFFTKQEILDGDERPVCGKCKSKQRCTKFFTIERFPKYLVIHLKRFSQERYRAKISSLVEYPVDGLDLSAFAAESYSGAQPKYHLYAVSCHSGSTHCGHYTAFCKHPASGKWNEYNDSRVSSTNEREVTTSDAYILFYELVS